MTERQRAVGVFGEISGLTGGLLFSGFHMGLGDSRNHDDYEGDGEDSHCEDHYGSRLGDGCVRDASSDQPAHEDGGYGAADGIAASAPLDELVSAVAAAAESVQHGIHHDIEHAHGEACHECAEHIYQETLQIAGEELDAHADEADGNGCKCGELIALAFEDEARRDAHAGVCDEVGEGAELGKGLAGAELVGDDHAHGTCEVGHERNHKEQREHHHDDRGVVLLFF